MTDTPKDRQTHHQGIVQAIKKEEASGDFACLAA